MGTRYLFAIQVDGEYKLAKYGQWDGYPEGQGVNILNALSAVKLDVLRSQVKKCVYITDEVHNKLWVDCGANPETGGADINTSNIFKKHYPLLHRSTPCDDVIFNIAKSDSRSIEVVDSLKFASESVWCEYAYVIDFDTNMFEVYKGFNESPLGENERFYSLPKDGKYYPVCFEMGFDLSELPTQERFLELLIDDEEEE